MARRRTSGNTSQADHSRIAGNAVVHSADSRIPFSRGTTLKFSVCLTALSVAVVASLGSIACDADPLSPFQPEVTNATDNFQLQATGVLGVTSTRSYSWSNTGTRATINHSTTTTGGSARVSIRDGAGATVYNEVLVPSLNQPTTAGAAGTWTIVLTMTDYSGTLNFRVQKL